MPKALCWGKIKKWADRPTAIVYPGTLRATQLDSLQWTAWLVAGWLAGGCLLAACLTGDGLHEHSEHSEFGTCRIGTVLDLLPLFEYIYMYTVHTAVLGTRYRNAL